MMAVGVAAAAWAGVALVLHLTASMLATFKVQRALPESAAPPADAAAVAVIVPVKGLDAEGSRTIGSLMRFDYPAYTLTFALDDPADPAIPVIREQMAGASCPVTVETGPNRLASRNPKMDTLSKAYAATSEGLVMHADANAVMEPGRLSDSVRRLTPGVGMVTATFAGVRPESPAAELEAAILNGYHARLLLTGHVLGIPSAIGKLMLYRRGDLEAAGGFDRLSENPADDTALERLVVGQGLRVVMSPTPLHQPLGVRRFGDVWRRQIRWLVMRRINHPIAHVSEAAFSALPGAVAAGLAAPVAGIAWPALCAAFLVVWYGAEAVFLWRAGLRIRAYSPVYWLMRDILLLPMWVSSLVARRVEWRGARLVP